MSRTTLVLTTVALAVALAVPAHGGGFGGGMHFGGDRFGVSPAFHGGLGPPFHGGRFGGGNFVARPGIFHGGFSHFDGGFGHFPVHRGFDDFRFRHAFPPHARFFFGSGRPFFFLSSRIIIVNRPFFFPPFGAFVSAPFFCFPCGIRFSTEAIFVDHIHRFHHFHGIPPHLHVAAGAHAVFGGA